MNRRRPACSVTGELDSAGAGTSAAIPRMSVIVPVLDEAGAIAATLQPLQEARQAGAEVLLVDAGSRDATVAIARPLVDKILQAPRGRSQQLNVGAAAASGELLVFLHADSILPPHFAQVITTALGERRLAWGRFDVRIVGEHPLLRLVSIGMNLRSRITGIATGDQAIFATRALFQRVGGFALQPLMEDIAFSKAAKRLARPLCPRACVRTSGRRWSREGVLRTILLMWRLRLAYYLGADPGKLAACYRDVR
jgi:rSAM/selenodomain-associated transferase 2